MPTARISLPAGAYSDTLGGGSVPVLTAGNIAEATPSIGDTLTVTGSNASANATFQWQESADGSTGWSDISGATSSTLDTSSGVADGDFVRRGVSDGVQGPVYTAAVQVIDLLVPTFTRVVEYTENTQYNSLGTLTFAGADLSSIPVGDEVMVTLTWTALQGDANIGTPTLGGVAMNAIPNFGNNGDGLFFAVIYAAGYRLPRPAGSGVMDIVVPVGTGICRGFSIHVDHVQNRTADVDTANILNFNDTQNGLTVNTSEGGSVMCVHVGDNNSADIISFTNATPYGTTQRNSRNISQTAKNEGTSAGTLSIVSPQTPNSNGYALAVLSVE